MEERSLTIFDILLPDAGLVLASYVVQLNALLKSIKVRVCWTFSYKSFVR